MTDKLARELAESRGAEIATLVDKLDAQAAVIERVRAVVPEWLARAEAEALAAAPVQTSPFRSVAQASAAPWHTAPAKPCDETGVHKDCDCEDPSVVGYPEHFVAAPEHTAPPTTDWVEVLQSHVDHVLAAEEKLAAANARVAELEETVEVLRAEPSRAYRTAQNITIAAANEFSRVQAERANDCAAEAAALRAVAESHVKDNVLLGEENKALRAKAEAAQAILSEPGMWSDFAARALKSLRG